MPPGPRDALAAVASPGRASILDSGEAYASGDVTAALGSLDEILRRGGKTVWEREALFLRAKIRQKDVGNLEGALRDLRTLSVRHPATPAAAFAQFRIGRLYEESGDLREAYREYVLCARLRPVWQARSDEEPPQPWELPALRLQSEPAAELVARAALRAARLLHELPPDRPTEEKLPPRTSVVPGRELTLAIPPDPADRPAPSDRADVWYVVAPGGAKIGELSLEFSAAVDPMAAGPQAGKRYGLVVEPLPPRGAARPALARGSGGIVAMSGSSASGQKFARQAAIDPPAGVLRLTLYRNGSRITKCELRARVAEGASAHPGAPETEPATGFLPATPPSESGAGGVALARRPDGSLLLAYHSPGPAGPEEPDEDTDLYLTSSADGRSWERPVRLGVSSACEDRDPTLAVLGDGRTLLAWTSDRRAAGTSDIYVSESRDGVAWTRPTRLEIPEGSLESIGPRARATFHVPALHVDSSGRIRLFFVARGFREQEDRASRMVECGTGLYGVASEDGRLWGEPSALVSTPQVHLDRWKPAPKGEGRETISHLARPAPMELAPGRLAVAWVSSWGRIFLSRRERPGQWALEDLRVAGQDPSTAARGVSLVGPLGGGGFGLVVSRRDIGATALWPEGKAWRAEALALAPLAFEPGAPASSRLALPGGERWLTAWIALRAEGPSCVYVRELAGPGR